MDLNTIRAEVVLPSRMARRMNGIRDKRIQFRALSNGANISNGLQGWNVMPSAMSSEKKFHSSINTATPQ